MFSAIDYQPGTLKLIDQRVLPHQISWVLCSKAEQVIDAIQSMVVRGAPAIGCAAAYGLHLHAHASRANCWNDYQAEFRQVAASLREARPTAVNLAYAIDHMIEVAATFVPENAMSYVAQRLLEAADFLLDDDLATCKAIGKHGLSVLGQSQRPINVLTHCNTGSLATAGYGTALGVIRAIYEAGQLGQVYVDETRPYLQGSRLTAFELLEDDIPCSLIVDAAAASLMKAGQVDLVVVGADRIAANGDTANKIGTYSLAVNANFHKVPFYIAAPLATFDPGIRHGGEIPIEYRGEEEVKAWAGHLMAPVSCRALNPSFDVTDHQLISGFITEKGVLQPPFTAQILTDLR